MNGNFDRRFGLDLDELGRLANEIENANLLIGKVCLEDFQTSVIVPFSECWFAPTAVTTIAAVKEDILSTVAVLDDIASKFSDIINAAIRNWNMAFGDNISYIRCATASGSVPNKLDESVMRDNNNGFMGVLTDKLDEIYGNLSVIRDKVDMTINDLKMNLENSNAFYGTDQMEALREYIFNKLYKFIETLDGDIAKIKSEIDNTKETYMSTAQENASLFTSSN